MTETPKDWKEEARAEMNAAWERMLELTAFAQLVRIALADDSHEGYQEAKMWLSSEEAE